MLSLASFLVLARGLADRDLGTVATTLAFFALFAGLGDVGMTRTVVRHVAADADALWATYRRAVVIRVAGGIAVASLTVGVVGVTPARTTPVLVLLAGIMATASGVTELGYAALRSIGVVGVEMATLVLERALFLAVVVVLLAADAGPYDVVVAYIATNVLTAAITARAVHRRRPASPVDPGSLLDREARRTAMGFALLTGSPRVSLVLVALLVGPEGVAEYAVAQRLVEAVVLFILATAAPLLPLVRRYVVTGLRLEAFRASREITGALLFIVIPLSLWWVAAHREIIDLLFGPGRYGEAHWVLAVLTVTTCTWVLRGIAEPLLLAEERASEFVRLITWGVAANLVLGVPLALFHGTVGAAVAAMAAELLMTGLLVRSVRPLFGREALRAYQPALLVGATTAVGLSLAAVTGLPALPLAAVSVLVGAVLAARAIRRLDARAVTRPRVAFIDREPPSSFMEVDQRCIGVNFDAERLVFPGRTTPGFVWRSLRAALRCQTVVAFFGSEHALVPALLFKALGRRFVLIPGGYDYANVPERRYGLAARGRGWLPKLLGRLADVALPISRQTEREFLTVVPSATNKTKLAYLAVDPTRWINPGSARDPSRAVTVAHVDEEAWARKGIDRFVECARTDPGREYVLAGRLVPSIEGRLAAIAPPNLVVTGFLGHEELRRLLWRCGVYVQLSWHETFGMAMAEAMLCGCTPVVTPCPALLEVAARWAVVVEDEEHDRIAIERAVSANVDRGAMRDDVSRRFTVEARARALAQAIAPGGV